MLDFLSNYWGTLVIGVIVAAAVVLIVLKMARDKKKGRTSCGCGCSGCPSAGICHGKPVPSKKTL